MSLFFEKINKIDRTLDRYIKQQGEPQTKSEMKMEKSQLTPQKCKGHNRLFQTTTCKWNGQPRRIGQIPRNVQSPRTEPGRNIKYKQINFQ